MNANKIFTSSALLCFTLCGASAQQTWTNNQGTGFWNNTDTNWGAGAAWLDSGSAIFDAGGGNPTVNAAVNVANLTLNATKTIAGTGPLTFVGPGSLLAVNFASTINTPISGMVTKTGTGQLDIATLNAGATLIINEGTVRGNTGGGATAGIRGTVQINSGATLRNTVAHIFDSSVARIHINGGTLAHGPAGYPEYYVPHGTSAADPGVQMTGGLWEGGGQNRFGSAVTAHMRFNAASTTATIAGEIISYQGGTQVYNVVGGTIPGGVDLRVSGTLGGNFGGGTTHLTKTGAGLMEITGTAVLNGPGQFNLTQGTLRLTGTTAVNNFGGSSVAVDAVNTARLQLNAVNAGDSLAFSKPITGGSANATVEKMGNGTVTFSSSQTAFTGNYQVSGGKLVLGGLILPTAQPAISGNTVWLDASDPDGNGIADSTNGATVSTWVNKAVGGAGNFTSAGTGADPVFTASSAAFNNKAVITFDDVGKQLNNTTNFGNTVSVIYVGQIGAVKKRLVSSISNNWLLGYWGGNMNSNYWNNGGNLGTATPADTNAHIWATGATNAVYASHRFDAGGETQFDAGTGTQGPNGLSLGGNTEKSDGSIAEMWVFNKQLSATERQQMEGYLYNKYFGSAYSAAVNLNAASTVTVQNGATLAGHGTTGAVVAENGATLEGGNNGSGTLTTGTMTLGAVPGDSITLAGTLSTTPGYSPISVSSLAINSGDGKILVNATGTGLTIGNTYDFLVSGSVITAPNATSVLAALGQKTRAFTPLVDGTGTKIQVLYSVADSIYWTGANGTAWNLADTNWKLTTTHNDTKYLESDTVFFHDRPEAAHTVDLSAGNVSPASVTFDNTTATTYTLQGANGIASGTLTKNGNGTVLINNTNPTAGAVALTGGTVRISQTGGLGTGDITFDGAALDYTGTSTTWTRNFTVNAAGATLGVADAGATLTANGTLGGGGGLVKSGAGVLAIGSANPAYAAGVTVSQGTLRLNNINAVGTNGAITLGNAGSGNEAITLAANVGSGTFSNPITVANEGSGTVTLRQDQNYSMLSGLLTLNRPTTIQTTAGDRAGISAKITGPVGTLTFAGTRTTMHQSEANASDFTGDVVIASGTLQSGNLYALPATASVTVNAGALYRPYGGAIINALSGAGTVHNNSGGAAFTVPLSLGNGNGSGDFSGTIQNGSGSDIVSIIKNGDGTQIFSGTNSYTGTTLISGGVLQVGNGGTGGTLGTGQITNNASLVFNRSDNLSFNLNVQGTGSFTQNGTGLLTIGSQDYTGETRVTRGTLIVEGTLPAAGLVTVSSGATLGGDGIMGQVTVEDGGILNAGLNTSLASLTLAPTSIVNIELDDPTYWGNDNAVIAGALTLGGTWNISAPAGGGSYDFTTAPAETSWLFMTYNPGDLTPGTVTIGTAPELAPGYVWTVDSTTTPGSIFLAIAVPEPASAGLLLLGAFFLRALRRRAR